jgi:hypothetical protein
MATPHGRSPTGTVAFTARLATSMSDALFDVPFALMSHRPDRSIATPHGRFPVCTDPISCIVVASMTETLPA